MKLYEQFLKEANLENASPLKKALACGCLMSVVKEPHNAPTYDSLQDVEFFPEECKELQGLVRLITRLQYYANELALSLIECLEEDGVESPLGNSVQETFKFIFDYLERV